MNSNPGGPSRSTSLLVTYPSKKTGSATDKLGSAFLIAALQSADEGGRRGFFSYTENQTHHRKDNASTQTQNRAETKRLGSHQVPQTHHGVRPSRARVFSRFHRWPTCFQNGRKTRIPYFWFISSTRKVQPLRDRGTSTNHIEWGEVGTFGNGDELSGGFAQ